MAGTSLAVVVAQAGGVMLPADPHGRYLHRFDVRSSSLDREGRVKLYTISFDTAVKRWKCACRGNIAHGKCKHLTPMLPILRQIQPEGVAIGPAEAVQPPKALR
jgi:hypothetical protein